MALPRINSKYAYEKEIRRIFDFTGRITGTF